MTEMEKRRIVLMRSAGESYKKISNKQHTNLAGTFCKNPDIILRLNLAGEILFSTREGEENGSD